MIYTSITLKFRDSTFTGNQHLNGGCFLDISGMTKIAINNIQFVNNDNNYGSNSVGKICILQNSQQTLLNEIEVTGIKLSVNGDKGPFFYSSKQDASVYFSKLEIVNAVSGTNQVQLFNSEIGSFQDFSIKGSRSLTGHFYSDGADNMYFRNATI